MKTQVIPLLAPAADTALDPHQKKFNRLLAQIETAKKTLARWDTEAGLFGTAHAQLVQPLHGDISRLRLRLVRQLDALVMQTKGWTATERELLTRLLVANAFELSEHEALTDAERDECCALHDRHADISIDAANREAAQEFKALFEQATGLDLGDEPAGSPEELAARARARMAESAQAQAQAAAPQPPRKLGKAALARAEREKADADAVRQSVREVFRKLAAALHPDRASDDADRDIRTERMQRVNQAYAADDLLALLALQLEIEQISGADLARVTSQRARQLNGLLAEQLQELKQTLQARQEAFAHGFELDPFEPLSPSRLGLLLRSLQGGAQADVHELQRDLRQLGGDRAGVKAWIKAVRRDQAAMDDMFEFPF